MRTGFCFIVALILSMAAYALPMNIECTGAHEVDGTDTLFFFADEIHVHSKIGAVDWYATASGMAVQTGSEDFYPDDGGYYIVKDGVEYSPFYVFRCQTSALEMKVEANCENTILRLAGDVNPYNYIRRNGTQGTYKRTCSVDYTALAWNGEQWGDSAVQEEVTLSEAVRLPAMYGATPIQLCYDADIREALGLAPACITGELAEDKVTAVAMQLTSLAVSRGTEGEKSNELNRPTRQDIITATTSESYSGALEVAFYANPSPAALYSRWTIYRSSEVIATRSNEKDIRYIFSEPGNYRVVCAVSNRECTTDSMSMIVNISESYLAVPNFFTPGGSCPNAEFRVAYRSLREFHGWVYNRWGKLVFEWTDPAKGWDGTINGRLAADGAYFYVIRALGTDAPKNAGYSLKASYQSKKKKGDESVFGVYQLSGDINLIRCRK